MITVIIPTLLKCQTFPVLLEMLDMAPSIKEVLIFDNTSDKAFKSNLSKIKAIAEGDMQVNPAWNEGVRRCHTDYYLLLNDDVLVDDHVLTHCLRLFENNNVGVVIPRLQQDDIKDYIARGLSETLEYKLGREKIKDHEMTGSFIMGRKSEWIKIPEQIQYFYGDNFIFDTTVIKNKKKLALLMSDYVSHYRSITVKAIGIYKTKIWETESNAYNQLFKEMEEIV